MKYPYIDLSKCESSYLIDRISLIKIEAGQNVALNSNGVIIILDMQRIKSQLKNKIVDLQKIKNLNDESIWYEKKRKGLSLWN